jgi:hypothetical protein
MHEILLKVQYLYRLPVSYLIALIKNTYNTDLLQFILYMNM